MYDKRIVASEKQFFRRFLIGMLLLVFFSLMAIDLLTPDMEPVPAGSDMDLTDTNVEAMNPCLADSLYHNEDSYPVSERPPVRF
jgi:hypothetical protein